MSLLKFNESKSSEVKQIPCYNLDSTKFFKSVFDSSNSYSIKNELQRIRGENPELYKALSLDKFD